LSFPVTITLFGAEIHPHLFFELIAYSAGFQIYIRTRHRWKHPPVASDQNLWIVVACVAGALVGSKLLNILDSPLSYWAHRDDPFIWFTGKTIVGGLIGGWIGVEIAKKKLGVRYATGDAYVFPLIAGMAIGRIGCFLSGLQDDTYGMATGLPWGIDFGDGIPRHPAQLYEIVILAAIGLALWLRSRRPYPNGYLFRLFMFLYFAMRFTVDMIKPRFHPWLGLSAIQIACLLGMIVTAKMVLEMRGGETVNIEPQLEPELPNG
jgi:prolipoprotein diacylglyceryltransferase